MALEEQDHTCLTAVREELARGAGKIWRWQPELVNFVCGAI